MARSCPDDQSGGSFLGFPVVKEKLEEAGELVA
jgi:hypothetical protein